ncbi:AlkA N-terminal domain-containing protein (plasmid) [Pseudoalteromonas espejiana]
MEWITATSYGRTFQLGEARGYFEAQYIPEKHHFSVKVDINKTEHLQQVINNIRRVLDVDADITHIENHLKSTINDSFKLSEGLRLLVFGQVLKRVFERYWASR